MSATPETSLNDEVEAIRRVAKALEPLSLSARDRVIHWAHARLVGEVVGGATERLIDTIRRRIDVPSGKVEETGKPVAPSNGETDRAADHAEAAEAVGF